MSETYKEGKCECGHYWSLHLIPGKQPLKLGRCYRLTGCACEKYVKVEA